MMQPNELALQDHFERQSGVYSRARPASVAPASFARGIAERVREIAPGEPVGVLVEAQAPIVASAAILPGLGNTTDYPMRDLSIWLRHIEGPARVIPVPTRLRMWVPVRLVAAFPIASPVFRAGAMFVACSGLTRPIITELETLATDIALELEAWARSETLSDLRRVASTY